MTARYLVLAMRTPAFDDAVIAPHLAFLDGLRARGLLEMAGGFSDRSGGAYLLAGLESLDAAKTIVAADPIARDGASVLTVHEWNTR